MEKKFIVSEKLRKIGIIVLVLFLSCGSFMGCNGAAAATDGESTQTVEIFDAGYSNRDLAGTWDEERAVAISLNGTSIAVSGAGASASGSTLTIVEEGVYLLSGVLSDGQIIVEAADTAKVQIVLNGATIACGDNAPIYVKSADKVLLTLAAGSENSVSDGGAYALEEGADEPDGTIFSKADLTINGSGTLTVEGKQGDGIVSKDDLMITGGTVDVTAADEGIRGKDSVAICGNGSLTIDSVGSGIKSTNSEDAAKGWICIDGGTFYITAQAKGINAVSGVYVNGGTLEVDTVDDAVHSNGAVTITGGILVLNTEDDGIHADGPLQASGGEVTVAGSYEGLEGASIAISGGTFDITSWDDGLNAAGGNDGWSEGGRTEEDRASGGAMGHTTGGAMARITGGAINPATGAAVAEKRKAAEFPATAGAVEKSDRFLENANGDAYFIGITGGTVRVNAGGDGIDSNGKLTVSGGTVQVSGTAESGNGIIDSDAAATISGGVFAGTGSSGMLQGFSSDSAQNTLIVTYDQTQQAGTELILSDEKGVALIAFTPEQSYQSVIISLPELEQGESYTLSGAAQTVTASLSAAVTSVAQDGSERSLQTMGRPGGGRMNGGQRDMAPPEGQAPPMGQES